MKVSDDDTQLQHRLGARLGRSHARLRLGIETATEPRVFGGGFNFFHPENWYSLHAFVRYCLKASGLYWRGRRNARNIQIVNNAFQVNNLPEAFEGFRILHLSDLHIDMDPEMAEDLMQKVQQVEYDICVMTGDYRARTFGTIEHTLQGIKKLREKLRAPVYAVLGNHDSIRMVPTMEDMDIRLLLNESVIIKKNEQQLYLAGIDDAHYFRADNVEKTADTIPVEGVSVLLSHTPEIYKQAAYAGFSVFLCGHTHGGQICLPGGIPVTLDARCPRSLGRGYWRYHTMQGYTSAGAGTSIVNVRLNCPPEITLHQLSRGAAG